MLKPLKTKIIKLSISVLSLLLCSTIFAEHRILVFGDSLSNAYGIEKKASWVALLKNRIKSQNINADNVIPRKPLGPNARRAGWQGCYLEFNSEVITEII